jgi:hypothetical protein
MSYGKNFFLLSNSVNFWVDPRTSVFKHGVPQNLYQVVTKTQRPSCVHYSLPSLQFFKPAGHKVLSVHSLVHFIGETMNLEETRCFVSQSHTSCFTC